MYKRILDYYQEKEQMHPHLRFNLEQRIAELESQKDNVRRRMKEIIKDYNFFNLPNVVESLDDVYQIEFFKGVDDFSIGFGLVDVFDPRYDDELVFKENDYGRGDEPMNDEEHNAYMENLIKLQSVYKKKIEAIPVDETIYSPILYDYYVQESRWNFNTRISYSWLAYQWQEVGGCEIGMIVGTCENNSTIRFSFNDFCFDNLSDYNNPQDPIKSFVPPAFPRRLTLEEIFMRTGWSSSGSFTTNWKYFERGDEYIEIGLYCNKTGLRKGIIGETTPASVGELKTHVKKYGEEFSAYGSNCKAAKYAATLGNQMIRKGWEEKLRPLSFPNKLFELAISFPLLSGNYFRELQLVNYDLIRQLEKENGLTLSNEYKMFLVNFGSTSENSLSFFTPDMTIDKIVRTSSFGEVDQFLKQKDISTWNKYLPIAESTSGKTIYLSCDEKTTDQIFWKAENENEFELLYLSFEALMSNKGKVIR